MIIIVENVSAQNQTLLPFKKDNQWGYINYNGDVIIQPQYDFAGRFIKSISIVKKNKKYGLIDGNNNFTLAPTYNEIRLFNDSIFWIRQDSVWGLFYRKSEILIQPFAREISEEKFGFFQYRLNDYSGLINQKGKIISDAIYDSVIILNKEFIIVSTHGQKGLINNEGTELLSPSEYEGIVPVTDDCYLISENNNWGIANANNDLTAQPIWDSYKILSSSFIILTDKKGSALYSIEIKKVLTDDTFDDFNLLNEQFIYYEQGEKFGLINKYKIITEAVYDDLEEGNERVIKVMKNKTWGLVDSSGNEIIKPEYDAIGVFDKHVATIHKLLQYGLINDKGKIIIPCHYSDIDQFENSATVRTDKNEVIIVSLNEEGDATDSTLYSNFHTISVRGISPYKNFTAINSSPDTIKVNQFAWFFSKKYKRWGLKNFKTDSIIIFPRFSRIFLSDNAQRTVVEVFLGSTDPSKNIDQNKLRYGVIDNRTYRYLVQPTYRQIIIEDVFNPNSFYARCINSENKNGIVWLGEKEIFIKYSFVGELSSDGLARVNIGGTLKKFEDGAGREDTIKLAANQYLDAAGRVRSTAYVGMRAFNWFQVTNGIPFWLYTTICCTGGKWGYITKTGSLIIKPQYTFAQSFISGRAIIKNVGKYGVINSSGETIIPFNYNLINHIYGSSDSLFELKVNGARYGFINREGNIIADPQYEQAMDFSEGLSAVKQSGKWGFIDSSGTIVIEPHFSAVTVFSEGFAAARLKNKWGYINSDGEWEIKNNYEAAGTFNSGLAAVKKNGRYCYINTQDKIIIKGPFFQAGEFRNEVAVVKLKKKFGFINTDGKWVIRPKYNSVLAFDENDNCKVRKKNKYGIINSNGKVLANCRYDFLGSYSEGMAVAAINRKYGYIDTTGRWIIKPQFQLAGKFYNGTASVKQNNKFGLIDDHGEWILDPLYSYCGTLNGGVINVKQNGKNSFINTEGKYLIARKNGMTQDFSEGITIVRESKYSVYFIDLAGNKLFNTSYENATPFKNGFAWVCVNSKWGLIDKNGLMIIDPKFSRIENFKNGFAKFKIESQSGVANLEGTIILNPEAEKISYEGKGIFRIENGSSIGYVDAKSKWVLAMNR